MLEVISLLSNILTNPSSPMKELLCEIPFIISNHPDLKYIAEQFEIPFFTFRSSRTAVTKVKLRRNRKH